MLKYMYTSSRRCGNERSMSDLKRLALVVEHADLHLNVLASCFIASLKLTTVQGQIEVIAYVA